MGDCVDLGGLKEIPGGTSQPSAQRFQVDPILLTGDEVICIMSWRLGSPYCILRERVSALASSTRHQSTHMLIHPNKNSTIMFNLKIPEQIKSLPLRPSILLKEFVSHICFFSIQS
jgi:hypothetical protein